MNPFIIGLSIGLVPFLMLIVLMASVPKAAKRNIEDANDLLRERNDIGERQASALEEIFIVQRDSAYGRFHKEHKANVALVAALKRFDQCYTDAQLKQLAEAENGMGEVDPEHAQRLIQLRQAIALAEGGEE